MKISRIWDSPKNKYLVNVQMDDDTVLTLPQYFMKRSPLQENQEFTEEQIAQLRADYIAPRVSKKALDYLSKRMYGSQELMQKLEDFGFLEEDIEPVIDKYTDLGYLNDEAFARSFVHDGLELKRWPVRRIRMELTRKGVAPELVEAVFFEFEGAEHENLEYLLARKLRGIGRDDQEAIQKIKLQFMRKGYPPRLVNQTVVAYFEREED